MSSQDVRGDLILVTRVEPADDESDQVHFVWLASDADRMAKYIGCEHRFSPDRVSFQRFKRVS